jgi:hypothetical protein
MSLDSELGAFYSRSGFGPVIGERPRTVKVYTGCMLVPLPNIETRRRFLKYHDLHHLITGYSVGRIGEGEVSAWELGTGSMFVNPILGLMNLIALSTGLALEPGRVWRAFQRGCISRNLYPGELRSAVDGGRWPDVAALRGEALEVLPGPGHPTARAVEFAAYALAAGVVHACLVIPALIARYVTDVLLGKGIFESAKPVRRTDLY